MDDTPYITFVDQAVTVKNRICGSTLIFKQKDLLLIITWDPGIGPAGVGELQEGPEKGH